MIPQLMIIFLFIFGLGVNVAKHNENKKSEYNGWSHLIAILIFSLVLYFGGFWNVFFV